MSSSGHLLLLLLLAPPLWPFSLPPPDTPEGKATISDLILSVLERATSFLKKRLPEIDLDGVVGFRVLEGGCSCSPGPATGKTSSQPVPCLALHLWDLVTFWPQIICYKEREVGVACSFRVCEGPAVIKLFKHRKDSKATREKIWKLLFSLKEVIHLTVPTSGHATNKVDRGSVPFERVFVGGWPWTKSGTPKPICSLGSPHFQSKLPGDSEKRAKCLFVPL